MKTWESMCLDTCMVRRQWMGVSSLLWPYGSQELNSCCRVWWQAPFPLSHLDKLQIYTLEKLYACLLQGLYLKIDISVSKAEGSDFSTSLILFDIFNFLKIAIRSVKWFFIVGWTLFYFILFWFGAVVWYWDRNQRSGVLILSYILSLSYGSNLHFSANQSAGHLFMSLFSICQVLLSISKC